jgi:hypothetical protein
MPLVGHPQKARPAMGGAGEDAFCTRAGSLVQPKLHVGRSKGVCQMLLFGATSASFDVSVALLGAMGALALYALARRRAAHARAARDRTVDLQPVLPVPQLLFYERGPVPAAERWAGAEAELKGHSTRLAAGGVGLASSISAI